MILCDDQSGSKELFPYLQKMTSEVILTRIHPPFGDFVWVGNGPDGRALNVAVEYKQFNELLDSIYSGRLSGHQVGGLVEHYDRRYLLIEGRVRTDRNTGAMQEYRGDTWRDIVRGGRVINSRDIDHYRTTLEEQAQFRTEFTYDRYQSARWVANKHSWYTAKGWNDHDGLKQFHVEPPPTASFQKPNLVRRWAKEITDIGWDKAIAANEVFKTPLELALADESAWRRVDGIGKVISVNAVREIRGLK